MLEIPEIQDVDIAFGTTKALPKFKDIPREFTRDGNKWKDAASSLFFKGGRKSQFKVKDGVDADKAFRAIQAHLASWEPKHEHKEAGVAYMLSEWFDDYTPEG